MLTTTATDSDVDDSLFEKTGVTQILDDDMTVEAPARGEVVLGDDEATMQLPAEGGEFDFAKTEALSSDSFDGDKASTRRVRCRRWLRPTWISILTTLRQL